MAESMLHCKSGATLQLAWARESSSVEIVLQADGLSCRRTKLIFGGIELVWSIRFVEKVSGRCCKSIGLDWFGRKALQANWFKSNCNPIGTTLRTFVDCVVTCRPSSVQALCFGRSVLLKKKTNTVS